MGSATFEKFNSLKAMVSHMSWTLFAKVPMTTHMAEGSTDKKFETYFLWFKNDSFFRFLTNKVLNSDWLTLQASCWTFCRSFLLQQGILQCRQCLCTILLEPTYYSNCSCRFIDWDHWMSKTETEKKTLSYRAHAFLSVSNKRSRYAVFPYK